jgi:hypothetical protein
MRDGSWPCWRQRKSVPYYYIFRFANPLLKIHRILKQTNFEAPSNFYGMSVQDIENSVENKNTAEKIWCPILFMLSSLNRNKIIICFKLGVWVWPALFLFHYLIATTHFFQRSIWLRSYMQVFINIGRCNLL